MSFFGIGKKKLDEQSREEQSAETAKAQKEQASEDAPKSARLSEKIMEQQQWEDSLRRFVKSESARHQNQDDEQSEEHRAVEDLKRALLHDDEQVEENPSAEELTEEQVEEQERRSLLAALGAFPQESEEPVEVEQVAEVQDIEEDAAPVAEAPEPATPAFLRDDEEVTSEAEEPKDAAEDARSQFEKHLRAVRAQNSEDEVEESEIASADAEDTLTADDMKAARTRAAVTEAQNAGLDDLAAAYAARLGITLDSEEETFSEVASDEVAAEETTTEVVAEDADSAESAEITEPVEEAEEEQIEAVVEAPELLAAEIADEENAVSDETELLSAVSVEEKRDVSVSEAPEAKDFDAEEENTAELIFDASAVEESTLEETAVEEPATKIEDSAAEGTESAEDEPAKSSSVAPALAAGAAPVVVAAAVASAAKTEKAEEKTEKGTSQGVALTAEGIDKKEAEKHEATSATGEESAEEPAAELKEAEQKLSEDEAELVAESIILSAPVEGAATLPALPEQRALHGLAELMRTRGSGTMSLELRQVDEDMHYRLLHRGREVETGIVVPGVDWFAPVAALYTEAQQAGATWNRAAVSLNPRLGDGLEVHASYLGMADGQTTRESFLLEGAAAEAKPVATAEAAEAASQDEPQEAAVQNVDPVEAEREAIERELEAELAQKQVANEVEAAVESAEEPVAETAEEPASSGLAAAAGLAAAGTAVAGSAVASAQEKEDVEEAVEASDEPAQPAQAEFAPVEAEFEHDYENDPVFGEATVEPETEHAEESAAEAVAASAEDSVEPGEDMEAALATIVANAQKKLDAEEEAPATVAEEVATVEDQKVATPAVAESFTLDRTQPVEESAEEPVAEKAEEPALPAFLDDSDLLPEHETSTEAASAEASAEAPVLEDAEPVSESASVAPGLAGALAAAAAVGTAGAAAKAPVAQEEPAEKVAELKTVGVTPAAKIGEAPAALAPASEAAAQTAPAAPVAPATEAAPAAATAPVALPESTPAGISSSISASALSELNQLPTIVAEPDTPSAAVQSPLVPSETQLASGNLVLTEAQVAQRLAPVVEHLFGENGTAKDATTVLIRVRALGSYYDALTHVRRNGFWEQVRTFELIPETLLDIPALKTDSYSEGEGSPLAMSLTFTPGVPVQAAFDYANEQAFVTYPRPLDAERYVEELRMFPRLGSKIPAHMTSALSHWNL